MGYFLGNVSGMMYMDMTGRFGFSPSITIELETCVLNKTLVMSAEIGGVFVTVI